MSEFDKEAEREKLREQFAEDDDRADTQRMSELLLKGATMTNRHCDDCGDPVFRWEGEEFCPSCSAGETAGGEGSAASAGNGAPAGDSAPAGATESASPGTNATVGADSPAGGDDAPASAPPNANQLPDAAQAGGAASGRSTDAGGVSPEDFASVADDASADAGGRQPPADGQRANAAPSQSAQTADLGAARASLSRTVTRFAQEAERADDLARAREYLDAVAAAADALAAVRRAGR
jgi:uncharacterized Zn finger protein (UPF0148 family)